MPSEAAGNQGPDDAVDAGDALEVEVGRRSSVMRSLAATLVVLLSGFIV